MLLFVQRRCAVEVHSKTTLHLKSLAEMRRQNHLNHATGTINLIAMQ